jgi:hypothetical protein
MPSPKVSNSTVRASISKVNHLSRRYQTCSLIESVRGSLSNTYDADEMWKI